LRARASAAILRDAMPRRGRTRNSSQRLRTAVEAMPRFAREAMLRGLDSNTIIAGAYTDPDSGGICPMLAAHRNGGRTSLASFARCWDSFTDARRPRVATERELRTLRAYLEWSLVAGGGQGSLRGIAAELRRERAACRERERAARHDRERDQPSPPASRPERRPTGERDRSAELGERAGWAWTPPARSLAVYEQRVAAASERCAEGRAGERRPEPAGA
jgi:hypothetical protein